MGQVDGMLRSWIRRRSGCYGDVDVQAARLAALTQQEPG